MTVMRFDGYDWTGGREAMLRFGPAAGPVAMVVPPLFEEANRTRAIAVAMLRALAGHGIAGALPDLPGQGESLLPTEAATMAMLRAAVEAAVRAIAAEGRPVHIAAIRSGALLGLFAPASGYWHLSPQDGPDLLRELGRIKRHEDTLPDDPPEQPLSIAGNLIAPQLPTELATATLDEAPEVPRRVIRLGSDPRPADHLLPGAPPWRRAEPGNDDALAGLLADDLAAWIARCEG